MLWCTIHKESSHCSYSLEIFQLLLLTAVPATKKKSLDFTETGKGGQAHPCLWACKITVFSSSSTCFPLSIAIQKIIPQKKWWAHADLQNITQIQICYLNNRCFCLNFCSCPIYVKVPFSSCSYSTSGPPLKHLTHQVYNEGNRERCKHFPLLSLCPSPTCKSAYLSGMGNLTSTGKGSRLKPMPWVCTQRA